MKTHLKWDYQFSALEHSKNKFSFAFQPTIARKEYSFSEEVANAIKRLESIRDGKKLAIAYSGGIKSEIIIREVYKLGIPFEIYFLDIWGLNREPFNANRSIEREIQKQVHVIELRRQEFYDSWCLKEFDAFGINFPTYLALTFLFSKIPSDQFIVVGDGSLDRSGRNTLRFNNVPNKNPDLVPFTPAHVYLDMWAEANKRAGEFYFYQSTPELIASIYLNKNLEKNYPTINSRKIIYENFPNLEKRDASTNWDNKNFIENSWIREWISTHATKNKLDLSFTDLFCQVAVDDIFLK